MEFNVEQIARICHEANRAYAQTLGATAPPTWEESPAWMQASECAGVRAHLSRTLTPQESHEAWMKERRESGWVYGPDKNIEQKTHPALLPYEHLPLETRLKDYIFRAVVEAFKTCAEMETPVSHGA